MAGVMCKTPLAIQPPGKNLTRAKGFSQQPVRCAYSNVPGKNRGKKEAQKRAKILPPPRLSGRDLSFEARVDITILDSMSNWLQERIAGFSALKPNWLHSKYDEKIIQLAGPALLTLAADPLLSIVDTAFVGKLGANELAALGVNTAIYSLAFVLFNFLATATTPLIASSLSTGDREKAGQITFQAFILAGILGLTLMGGLFGFSDDALMTMGATGDVAVLGKEYLLARAAAAPAAIWSLACLGVFRGLQDMRTPLLITLVANSVNLVLDPVLIYGMGMGVKGAALSTSFAECSSAFAYTFILWNKHRDHLGLNCSLQTALRRAQSGYLPFLSAGGTMLLRTSVLLGTKTLASSVATHLGPVSISAHQVVAQLWLLFSLMTDSLAISGQSLVAGSLGQKDRETARRISIRLIELGLGMGLVMMTIFGLSADGFPHLFTNDPAIVSQVHSIMPLAVLALPINSLAYVLDGIMTGAEDFEYLAWSMVFTAFLISTSLLLVEPLHLGLEGVWVCQSLLMLLRAGTLAARFNTSGSPVPPLIDIKGSAEISMEKSTQQVMPPNK